MDGSTVKRGREAKRIVRRKRVLGVADPVSFRLTRLPCMPLRNALNLGPICQRYLWTGASTIAKSGGYRDLHKFLAACRSPIKSFGFPTVYRRFAQEMAIGSNILLLCRGIFDHCRKLHYRDHCLRPRRYCPSRQLMNDADYLPRLYRSHDLSSVSM